MSSVPASCRVLAVQATDQDIALNPFGPQPSVSEVLRLRGIAHTLLDWKYTESVAQFAARFNAVNLDSYDVIAVGTLPFNESQGPFAVQAALTGRKAQLETWLRAGNGLVALTDELAGEESDPPNPSHIPYAYLPELPIAWSDYGETVSITQPAHPVMTGLTSADLSDWNGSYFNRFNPPASYQVLARAGDGVPLTLAWATAGRVALTGQSPDYTGVWSESPAKREAAGRLLENMVSWACATQPGVDLRITEVKPVQVVNDPHLDNNPRVALALNKATTVRVRLDPAALVILPDNQSIAAALRYGSVEVRRTRTVAEIRSSENGIDIFFDQFPGIGPGTMTVRVDPANTIPEADEMNNEKSVEVIAEKVRPWHIAYVPIRCTKNPARFSATATAAAPLLRGLFPVSQAGFTSQVINVTPVNCDGSRDELFDRINYIGDTFTNGKAEMIGGVVHPDDARRAMGRNDLLGLARCRSGASPAAIVVDGRWDVVPHEIGHLLGLSHPDPLPRENPCRVSPGRGPTDGFWVEFNKSVPGSAGSFMLRTAGELPAEPAAFSRWIARDDYERVFAGYFRADPTDPELLRVGGLISTSGRVDWTRFSYLPSGNITETEDGPYTVQLLNRSGRVLSSLAFNLAFGFPDDPNGPDDMTSFGFKLAYKQRAWRVRILLDGQVLAQQRIADRLLRDTITAIPADAFERDPAARRRMLRDMVEEFEAALVANDLAEASVVLADIRDRVARWLKDYYELPDPLAVTKANALRTIDALAITLASADTDSDD